MFGLAVSVAPWLEAALLFILVSTLCMLATERQMQNIRLVAFQGAILGIMPILVTIEYAMPEEHGLTFGVMGASIIFLCIKAVVLPYILRRTHNDLPPQPQSTPYIGHKTSVLLGLLGFAFSLWLVQRMPIPENPLFSVFFPVSMATMFAGLLSIISRRTALNQVIGYLVLENGIYLLGVPLAGHDALWIELSTLLDLFVAVFVMGIAIHRISKAFDSTDVHRMALLKD